ncbi:MAG: DUF368 domain-containing protein [Methanomassiliicoccaceae archaeon]|jgi:putative membrane protein|nr:DUF368 domain-containing protein [Methanomassiliicoccaceae archaeon]
MDAKDGSKNFLIGILLGAATWIPGISGGVVAILFGVYERLIDDVNNLRAKIREEAGFLLTLGIGVAIGLLIIVYIVDYMMSVYLMATMLFFVGLIVGQLPDLLKITKRGEPTKAKHIVWLALGLAVMIVLLIAERQFGDDSGKSAIMDSGLMVGIALSFIAGSIFAVSKIVPGISGSTVLLVLGLYVWMNTIIKELNLVYLLPFAVGFVIAVFLFAKVMWHIIENHHHALDYFVIGLTVGSMIVILAMTDVGGLNDILIGCVAAAAGILISLTFSKFKGPAKNGTCGS